MSDNFLIGVEMWWIATIRYGWNLQVEKVEFWEAGTKADARRKAIDIAAGRNRYLIELVEK